MPCQFTRPARAKVGPIAPNAEDESVKCVVALRLHSNTTLPPILPVPHHRRRRRCWMKRFPRGRWLRRRLERWRRRRRRRLEVAGAASSSISDFQTKDIQSLILYPGLMVPKAHHKFMRIDKSGKSSLNSPTNTENHLNNLW